MFKSRWCSAFIWTNLNPLHPRMLCAKFGWKWPSGSEEDDFKMSSMLRCLLFEKKLESPSIKDVLCQVLLKLAQWLWRRKWKYENFTDGWTDGRLSIRKAHLSFQTRWVKKGSNSWWKDIITTEPQDYIHLTLTPFHRCSSSCDCTGSRATGY